MVKKLISFFLYMITLAIKQMKRPLLKKIIFSLIFLVIALFIIVVCGIKIADRFTFHIIYRAPFTITEPGYYRVINNLNSNSHGIIIASDDVVLDLAGFQINSIGPNPSATGDAGIMINKQQNITIRNGTIKGFNYGIYAGNIRDYGGNLFENLKLIRNLQMGICVASRNSVIRNNLISQTYGSGKEYTYGIYVEGPGTIIKNNEVFGTYPSSGQSEGVGISLTNTGRGSLVEENVVANSKDLESGRSFGIWVGAIDNDNTAVGVINNRITNMVVGIASSAAVNGVYRDNIVLDSQMNYFANTINMKDGGNNFGDGYSGNQIKGLSGESFPDYK